MKETAAEPAVMKTVTKRPASSKKVREVHIEPADNGYTVQVRHHGDYMEPGPPPRPKVFEKKHGHEMLKHIARKLGIRANVTEKADTDAGNEPDDDGDE